MESCSFHGDLDALPETEQSVRLNQIFTPKNLRESLVFYAVRGTCPNRELFLVCIFPYSVQIRENTDQKKLSVWTHFTQHTFLIAL